MDSQLNLQITENEEKTDSELDSLILHDIPKKLGSQPKTNLEVPVQSEEAFPNNGWTDRKVKQLRKKMDQLKILRYLHKKVAGHYTWLNDILSLPNITIEAVVSASLFVSLSEKVSDDGRFWINMVLGFIALIGTILGVWIKYFRSSEKMHSHADASREYANIYDDIDDQLAMEPDERISGRDYLRHIKKMIAQQDQNELDIDQKYWDEYFESITKGELVNLNYTLINPENQKNGDTVIEIDPEMIDNPSGDIGLSTTILTDDVKPPQTIVSSTNYDNTNYESDEDDLCQDPVRFHFNRMTANNLKKNLKFQMGRKF